MISGSIDISVGGVVALIRMSPAVYLDIPPFMVSLAGMFFARGMTTMVYTAKYEEGMLC